MKQKILFVVTSHDKKGSTNEKTGYYLGEVSHPWSVLKDEYEIDFVSPQGGTPPVDGFNLSDPVNKAFVENESVQKKLKNTLRPSEVTASAYAAIFFAGGHGTMWDFPVSVGLSDLASKIYENGGIVAAVCHGTSALSNVRLGNGKFLVEGKRDAVFTNEEERAVKLDNIVPFLLEDKMIERGAIVEKAGLWQEKVVTDGRLITGQNPASAKKVGEEMLKILRLLNINFLGTDGPALDVMGVNSDWLINGEDEANVALKELLSEKPQPDLLRGKNVAVVVTDGVEEIEITFVRKVLADRGARVSIISPPKPSYPAVFGAYVPANRDQFISTVKWMQNSGYLKIDHCLNEVNAKDYHLIYIPGGSWNPDALRADKDALKFIKEGYANNISIASICHGPWVLISAGLVKDKKVTAWWSMHDDLKNAGGIVVDAPVVKDNNMITSRGPVDLAPFTRALIQALMSN